MFRITILSTFMINLHATFHMSSSNVSLLTGNKVRSNSSIDFGRKPCCFTFYRKRPQQRLHILRRSIILQNLRNAQKVSLVSLPPQILERQPFCVIGGRKLEKYKTTANFSGTTFIPSFMKTCQLIQNWLSMMHKWIWRY